MARTQTIAREALRTTNPKHATDASTHAVKANNATVQTYHDNRKGTSTVKTTNAGGNSKPGERG